MNFNHIIKIIKIQWKLLYFNFDFLGIKSGSTDYLRFIIHLCLLDIWDRMQVHCSICGCIWIPNVIYFNIEDSLTSIPNIWSLTVCLLIPARAKYSESISFGCAFCGIYCSFGIILLPSYILTFITFLDIMRCRR